MRVSSNRITPPTPQDDPPTPHGTFQQEDQWARIEGEFLTKAWPWAMVFLCAMVF